MYGNVLLEESVATMAWHLAATVCLAPHMVYLTFFAIKANIRRWQEADLIANGEAATFRTDFDHNSCSFVTQSDRGSVRIGRFKPKLIALKVHKVRPAEAAAKGLDQELERFRVRDWDSIDVAGVVGLVVLSRLHCLWDCHEG